MEKETKSKSDTLLKKLQSSILKDKQKKSNRNSSA